MAKSGRLELRDNSLSTLQVYLQPLWCNWPAKQSNSVKKGIIRSITPFKVIQGHRGRYQSKAHMRLPISDKCKKRCLQKTVIGDVGAHPKPQKNHRFVRFVMYCSITTVPVAFYWAHSDDTVPFRSYRSLLFKFWTPCVFEPPFGELTDNVRCSSWAHWKARSGLPFSVDWTFSARCYGWSATGKNR